MTRFGGRVVLLTGAGHGIGRASALRFAAEGARVAVSDIDEGRAEQTAAACRDLGATAHAAQADASSPEDVERLVGEVVEALGPVDILHNNAGVLIPGSAHEQTLDEWDRTFAVNVRSVFLVTRAVLPGMLGRGAGVIVSTASTAGLVGDAGVAAYNASKAAVVNFTRHLTAEYAGRGIRANCVCPGWINTGFNAPIFAADPDLDEDELVATTVPAARQASPEEVAAVVAFLASGDASYVYGHALAVDGGLTAV
jgi:meso-butanediol dehydrogenase / (S,S)-butanediol dehydrogenase / diacetyl reductase